MKQTNATQLTIFLVAMLALPGCGGGDASIGGTVVGLGAGLSLTLQNNNTDYLTVTSNQSFAFAKTIASKGAYDVTVLTQPVGQTCVVANGSGTVDSSGGIFSGISNGSVNNITVTCANSASVGGVVSGLVAGTSVTLSNNGVLLPVAVNGPFAFPGILPVGSTYAVSVTTQPFGRTCTLSNPSGTVVADVIASVAVNCK